MTSKNILLINTYNERINKINRQTEIKMTQIHSSLRNHYIALKIN